MNSTAPVHCLEPNHQGIRLPALRWAIPAILLPLTLFSFSSCRKGPDVNSLLRALEQAVRQHDYYYTQDPPIPRVAYERAAREIAPGTTLDATPVTDQLARLLEAVAADNRPAAIRKAFNILLAGDQSTDPAIRHNYYVGPDTDARLHDTDNAAGAGIVLFRENAGSGRFRIVDVLEGSPAQLAAIPQGSVIEAIDGRSLVDLELEDVVALIRGKTGTSVQIRADGKDYPLVRGMFAVQLLRRSEWDAGGKRVLYVELRSVEKGAAKDLESLLMKSSNLDALVLDLRKLNRGDIDESFDVADLFVASKPLGIVRRRGIAARTVQADGNILFTGKVFVLVSQRTSAHLKTLVMGLRQSPQVTFIGPDMPLQAFAATSVPLDERGESGHVVIVDSVIDSPGETRLHPEAEIEDFVPTNPPSAKPDPNDPGHSAVLKRL